ncbi:MAG: hypothetical protein RLZZ126_1443 [Pseudomonadota bacterium]|jgi:hypothetical protein
MHTSQDVRIHTLAPQCAGRRSVQNVIKKHQIQEQCIGFVYRKYSIFFS